MILKEATEEIPSHVIIIKTRVARTKLFTDIMNAKYLTLPDPSGRFYKWRLEHFYIRLKLLLPDPSGCSHDNNEDQISAITALSYVELEMPNVNT